MNNLELANEGLRLLDQDSHSNTAVFTRLRQTSQLTTYLLAQRQPDEAVAHANIVKLFEKMDRLFNESDLRDICFRLSLDYESLGGGANETMCANSSPPCNDTAVFPNSSPSFPSCAPKPPGQPKPPLWPGSTSSTNFTWPS